MCSIVISQITILKFASIIFADAHNHAYYQEYYTSTILLISPVFFLQMVAYPRELDPFKMSLVYSNAIKFSFRLSCRRMRVINHFLKQELHWKIVGCFNGVRFTVL